MGAMIHVKIGMKKLVTRAYVRVATLKWKQAIAAVVVGTLLLIASTNACIPGSTYDHTATRMAKLPTRSLTSFA
jgi:hypothetical protein